MRSKWSLAILICCMIILSGCTPNVSTKSQTVQFWVSQLESNEIKTRRDAVIALGNLGKAEATPHLIKLTQNEDECLSVAIPVCEALSKINKNIGADFGVDFEAWKMWWSIHKPGSTYYKNLQSQNYALRRMAAKTYSVYADETDLRFLRKALKDPDALIRKFIVTGLIGINSKKSIGTLLRGLEDTQKGWEGHGSIFSDPAFIALTENLDKLDKISLVSYARFGQSNKRRILTIRLLRLIKEKDSNDKIIVPALIKIMLKDRYSIIRSEVAQDFAVLCEKSTIPALIKVVAMDKDPFVRECAAYALGRMGAKNAAPILIKRLGEKDTLDFINGYAEALGNMDDKRAVPALISVMEKVVIDKDYTLDIIATSLKKLTGQDFGIDKTKWQEWWEANKDRILKEEAEKGKK